jgi:leucyl-tRNA synthetase
MFVAPPEKDVEWTDSGLEGAYRFLGRVWRFVDHLLPALEGATSPAAPSLDAGERALRQRTHATIQRVTRDIDPRIHLNTAVSAVMELVNELYAFGDARGVRPAGRDGEPPAVIDRPETAAVLREAVEALVLLLSPFTPHLSEELWEGLGHAGGLAGASWPVFDAEAAREETVEVPVQVNGKVRGRVMVPADALDAEIEAAARSSPQIAGYLVGMVIVKVVVANRRLVNIVVRPETR